MKEFSTSSPAHTRRDGNHQHHHHHSEGASHLEGYPSPPPLQLPSLAAHLPFPHQTSLVPKPNPIMAWQEDDAERGRGRGRGRGVSPHPHPLPPQLTTAILKRSASHSPSKSRSRSKGRSTSPSLVLHHQHHQHPHHNHHGTGNLGKRRRKVDERDGHFQHQHHHHHLSDHHYKGREVGTPTLPTTIEGEEEEEEEEERDVEMVMREDIPSPPPSIISNTANNTTQTFLLQCIENHMKVMVLHPTPTPPSLPTHQSQKFTTATTIASRGNHLPSTRMISGDIESLDYYYSQWRNWNAKNEPQAQPQQLINFQYPSSLEEAWSRAFQNGYEL